MRSNACSEPDMRDLFLMLRIMLGRRGFKCRVLPPGAVFASKLDHKTLTILIDLEELDAR